MAEKNKVFMKPGATNEEDRENFVKYWAAYIKSVPDEVWSEQQNLLINSQLATADHGLYLKLNGFSRTIAPRVTVESL